MHQEIFRDLVMDYSHRVRDVVGRCEEEEEELHAVACSK